MFVWTQANHEGHFVVCWWAEFCAMWTFIRQQEGENLSVKHFQNNVLTVNIYIGNKI